MNQIRQHKPDGRRKKRPGLGEQREIILRSATALFARHGSQGVSIARICEQADISRPTFYRCFNDKDELLACIYDAAVNIHVTDILASGRLSDPEGLRATLDQMLEAIFDNAELARMIFVEAGNPGSPAAVIVDRAFNRAARALARDLNARDGEAPSTAYLKALMAAIQWLVSDAIDRGLDRRARRQAADAAFALITRALAPADSAGG